MSRAPSDISAGCSGRPGTTNTAGYTYDGAGHLVAMTYPSGAIVTYTRQANGRINRVDGKPTATAALVGLVTGAGYAPFGPLVSLTFGNGRVQTRTRDLAYGIDARRNGSQRALSRGCP